MTPELAVRSRNATEEAILDAARQTLTEVPWERLTMDAIAKRAFVSRTAVYFYFDNDQAAYAVENALTLQEMVDGAGIKGV